MTNTVIAGLIEGEAPKYMSENAAGGDLSSKEEVIIKSGETMIVSTGTKVKIPDGFFGMLAPRSSLCIKFGLQMANSVGIIDSDYIGDIGVALINNNTDKSVKIPKGTRIAQLILVPYAQGDYKSVNGVVTERGEGGFGSTGEQ